MSAEDVLKRIEREQKELRSETYSAEGLVRLQDAMAAYDGKYKLVWSADLLKELKEKKPETSFMLGVPLLDDVIGGFREQQVITIGGHTAHGKTQFGLFLIEQLHSLAPLVIPLEQSGEELVRQRSENGYSVPDFLSPSALADRVTVDWIEERIVEGIAKHNTKVVLIDHLGYINDFGEKGEFRGENVAYRIGQVMKALKNVAKKWKVVILLLVHISQHDEGKPPKMEDIKNSSDIIQESDMVMLLWRKNQQHRKVRLYEDRAMVSIQKNRRTGRNANLGFRFNVENGRYEQENTWVDSFMAMAEANVDLENF